MAEQQTLGQGGWLVDKERRSCRDHPDTLTDDDVLYLISKIQNEEFYLSETIAADKPELNTLKKMRDIALISTTWIWFKRGGEVLRLKRKDVKIRNKYIIVTFNISKKQKRTKKCPSCNKRCSFTSASCRFCMRDLTDVPVSTVGTKMIKDKSKSLANIFTKYIVDWVQTLDELVKDNRESWLFPPLRIKFLDGFFDYYAEKPMTIRQFDYILQRLDPTMTSCLFRYGGVEKYLKLGYPPHKIQKIGDWSSVRVVEIYARRKGKSPAEQEWSDDPS